MKGDGVMRGKSVVVGIVLAGVLVLSVSNVFAAVSNKEDVAALKSQVAELQGKIAVLEQKMSAQNNIQASSASTASAPSGYYSTLGMIDDEADPFAMMD